MNNEQKFKNIRIESETKIYKFNYLKIDGIDCRHEFWEWDGIEAESLIFCTKELKELTDDYFQQLIRIICNTKAEEQLSFTTKSDPEYTYLNFNFKVK